MTKIRTPAEFDAALRKKFEESGIGHLLRDKSDKGVRERSTTIGAIFVPRPPTQEELNRTPEEKEARITQHSKELKELLDKAEEEEEETDAHPI